MKEETFEEAISLVEKHCDDALDLQLAWFTLTLLFSMACVIGGAMYDNGFAILLGGIAFFGLGLFTYKENDHSHINYHFDNLKKRCDRGDFSPTLLT